MHTKDPRLLAGINEDTPLERKNESYQRLTDIVRSSQAAIREWL